MTQDQDNVVTMFQTTIQFLDANGDTWKKVAAFADAVTRAKGGMEVIDTTADKQQTPLAGVTQDKAQLRASLEEKTLAVAGALSAFATKTGNGDLGAQVEMSRSSLDQMSDTALEQTAERVVDLANKNIASLADYNITAADVTALDGARKAFVPAKTAPREKVAGRKVQTQSLSQAVASVRSIFRRELDKIVGTFRLSNSEFYNGYFASRAIVSRTGTHGVPVTPKPVPQT